LGRDESAYQQAGRQTYGRLTTGQGRNGGAGHSGGKMFTKLSGECRMWVGVRMGRRPEGSFYRLGKLVGESLSG